MPPYRVLTRTEIATTESLVTLLQAHLVCDEIDAERCVAEDLRWRNLAELLPWMRRRK